MSFWFPSVKYLILRVWHVCTIGKKKYTKPSHSQTFSSSPLLWFAQWEWLWRFLISLTVHSVLSLFSPPCLGSWFPSSSSGAVILPDWDLILPAHGSPCFCCSLQLSPAFNLSPFYLTPSSPSIVLTLFSNTTLNLYLHRKNPFFEEFRTFLLLYKKYFLIIRVRASTLGEYDVKCQSI